MKSFRYVIKTAEATSLKYRASRETLKRGLAVLKNRSAAASEEQQAPVSQRKAK